MPVPKVGEHSILLCTNNCGTYVRPKRMAKEAAEALVVQLHGPEAKVLINTGRGICSRCRKFPSQQVKAEAKADQGRKDKLAAERLAAAERTRLTIVRERAARQEARKVRRVSMGQSMVRI
jgi:hypothetical protein